MPEFVSSLILREIVGQSLANEMLLASKQVTAREAKESGLVSGVHPNAAAVLAAAKATAAHMLSFPLAKDSLPLYKVCVARNAREDKKKVEWMAGGAKGTSAVSYRIVATSTQGDPPRPSHSTPGRVC